MPEVIQGTERRPLVAGRTLFDYADEVSAAVPASCQRTGRCRECVVEIKAGGDALSPRTTPEAYLPGGLPARLPGAHHGRPPDGRGVRHPAPPDAHPGPRRGHPHRHRPDGHGPGRHRPLRRHARGPRQEDGAGPRGGHRHHDRRVPAHRPAHRQGRGGLRHGEPAAVRWLGRDGAHLLRARPPGRAARRAPPPAEPRAARHLRAPGHRPQRGVRGGHRGQHHDARPVLRAGRDAHRRVAVPLARRSTRSARAARPPRRSARLAHQVGLLVGPRARVIGAPLISGHVGADIAADLVALDFGSKPGISLLVDIGTNTEVVLTDGERYLAASCPAGPAFEGGLIRFGMPGADGAIEKVRFEGVGRAHRVRHDRRDRARRASAAAASWTSSRSCAGPAG